VKEKKILVVDDEEGIRSLFEEMFIELGYSVWIAESGEKALEILEKEDIHVMFLDIRMPGMKGTELCKRIREDKPNACIYALTGYSDEFKFEKYHEAGFDDVFDKPVSLQILIKTAKDAFRKLES